MYVTEIPLSGGGRGGNLFYTYTDHLGSIISVTNSSGTVIARQNFDAWGRRRNTIDSSYLPNNTVTVHNGLAVLNSTNNNLPAWLFRGYTGHEMLDEFALINKNARLYDPVIGMMLSCDNYVSDATNTQDYHRYCYARNNPVKYTDPTGNWVNIAIGALTGGIGGYILGRNIGLNGSDLLWCTVAGAGIGALTGGLAIGVSSLGAGATFTGAFAGAVGNTSFALLQNYFVNDPNFNYAKSFLVGALSGGAGGAAGAAIGGGWGAAIGGAVGSGINTTCSQFDLEAEAGKRFINMNPAEIVKSVILGGIMAYSTYEASSALNYYTRGGAKFGVVDVSYRQFKGMQADYQRSRFWGKEYGGWLMEDGSYHGGIKGSKYNVSLGNSPDGHGRVLSEFHTHWEKPGIHLYTYKGKQYESLNDLATQSDIKTGDNYGHSVSHQYHSSEDLNHGHNSIVLNRYDGGYHPGFGGFVRVSSIQPPITRFIWSFNFWK